MKRFLIGLYRVIVFGLILVITFGVSWVFAAALVPSRKKPHEH